MSDTNAVKYEEVIPEALQALSGVHDIISEYDFDRTIFHLVQLRASQINQCGFCVKMHTREARDDGETSDRLDRVIVWKHVDDFSDREKAALEWTEALTNLENKTDYAAFRARLSEHFSDKEIGVLTSIVSMINLWNRIQVSKH